MFDVNAGVAEVQAVVRDTAGYITGEHTHAFGSLLIGS